MPLKNPPVTKSSRAQPGIKRAATAKAQGPLPALGGRAPSVPADLAESSCDGSGAGEEERLETKPTSSSSDQSPRLVFLDTSPVTLLEEATVRTAGTSTPLHLAPGDDYPAGTATRHSSPVLRIATQIREAKMAECAERARNAGEPLDSERDGGELGCSLDDRSMCMVGADGGGLLCDLPQQANKVLQSAKTALESSGNLRRDIKEALVGSLHTLYEMILRLADSRGRHIMDKQKQIIAHERKLAAVDRTNSNNLRAIEDRAREDALTNRVLLESIAKEIAAQRKDVVAEVREALEIMSSIKQGPTKGEVSAVVRKPRDRTPERLVKVHEIVEEIRSTMTQGDRAGGAIEREELVAEMRKLRADITETSHVSGALTDKLKAAKITGTQTEDLALEMGKHFDEMDHRLGALDAGLLRLQDAAGQAPVLAKLGEVGEALHSETKQLHKVTVEGLEQVKDEITAAAAMRHMGLNLHDELAMENRACPMPLNEDCEQGWKMARGGRKRGRRGAEPLVLRDDTRLNTSPPRIPVSHVVVVESVDPRHTSEDVTAKVKSSLDVVSMGIGINSLRSGRGQKIIVGCDTAAGQKSFRDAVESLEVGLSAETKPLKYPLLKLVGVVKDMTNEKLIEAITRQNKGLVGDLDGEVKELRVVKS